MTRDLLEEGKPDVTASGPLISKLLQVNSTSDLDRYPSAKPGDFLLALPNYEDIIVPRAKGVPLVFCAGVELFVEWAPGFSSGPPLEKFYVKPLDAERIETGFGWRRRSTGNKIEQTIELYALAGVNSDWPLACFPWKSTALKPVQKALGDASRIRTRIADAEAAVVGGVWKLTSEPDKNEYGSWFKPAFELKALVGHPGGPTPAVLQKAWDIRRELRLDEEEARAEQVKLFATQARLQIEHDPAPAGRQRGTATITSGRANLALRRPDLAPSDPGKPEFDDKIPW